MFFAEIYMNNPYAKTMVQWETLRSGKISNFAFELYETFSYIVEVSHYVYITLVIKGNSRY